MKRQLIGTCLFLTVLASALSGADWPAFRGPNGDGLSNEAVPTEWGPNKNIAWRVKLPQPGNGSAIVVKGKVFVCSAEDKEGRKRSVYCFDRKTGDRLWVRTVEFEKKMPTHRTNPYCGTTPVSDGKRVVVWHSSAGLYCYDLEGKELWSQDLGEFEHIWGYGSSPILVDGKVILNCGPGKQNFVAALNLDTGRKLWQVNEPFEGDGNRNELNNYMGSWATPIVHQVDGQKQIIIAQPKRIVAYAPKDGKILWSCEGFRGKRGDLAYSSPVIINDICVAIGGYQGPSLGVGLTKASADVERKYIWRKETNPQSIGTGVAIGDHIYRPNAGRPSHIDCLDPKTGEVVWSAPKGGGVCWGSIIAAKDNLLMVINQKGVTTMFRADPGQFTLVAENQLIPKEDLEDGCNATPALSDGQIFVRTFKHLVCIGEK